jgi:UDP-N-acetylglucosamine acyltransferase
VSTCVHPTSLIDPSAELDDGVFIGPFCVVGAGVSIGKNTRLISHISIQGPTHLGQRNVVHPFAALGGAPQDKGYRGEPTRLEIGDDNEIREHVTAHRGTVKSQGLTSIGNGCLLMASSHVAHDVRVHDRVILTNATLIGGHAILGDYVVCGGNCAVAPFVRVGESAFVAGGAMVERDVPPFVIAAGDRAKVRALNRVGLQRRGVPLESQTALKMAFLMIFRSPTTLADGLAKAELKLAQDPFVRRLVDETRKIQCQTHL